MASVRLEHVWKTFPGTAGSEVIAVRDLTLHVASGELLVLVGPSGCGKSTTLRLLAGLEPLSRGEIWIDDREVSRMAPKDRDIAMVFQNYALFPHMTVRENIGFGLKLRKVDKQERQRLVREVSVTLGLEDCLDRLPNALSGGQRQRVALGRAIVRHPKVFLLDEPLSNLDARMRLQMRGELIQLHRRLGTTMIYVTHDQAEAMTMGHRMAVMRDGVVQQVADPGAVYRAPQNRFVAEFVGSPPMNLVRGRLVRGTNGWAFHCLPPATSDAEVSPEPVPIPDGNCPVPNGENARSVWMGIRPESLRRVSGANGDSGRATFRWMGRVLWVENLGAEMVVHWQGNAGELQARWPAALAMDEAKGLALTWDPAEMHFFDVETEERLKVG